MTIRDSSMKNGQNSMEHCAACRWRLGQRRYCYVTPRRSSISIRGRRMGTTEMRWLEFSLMTWYLLISVLEETNMLKVNVSLERGFLGQKETVTRGKYWYGLSPRCPHR